jgi:hypothetical protein
MTRTAIGLAVALTLLLGAAVAFALPNDLSLFTTTYSPKAGTALANASCLTCHAKTPPSKELNPYGKDFLSKGRNAAALKAIENIDSDKDGATNIVEIRAGTLPGDPASKP